MRIPLTLLFLLAASTAHALEPPSDQVASDEPITLESLQNPVSKAITGISSLRMQMLTDAGRTVGFRGGQAARGRLLVTALAGRADKLDMIFQFSTLISKNGTVPPVIVEALDVASIDPAQIRTADRVYKIERPERFVSVPPTWRDYLFVGLNAAKGAVELPPFEARPQNVGEETIWKVAVKVGWNDGVRSADEIMTANFNRLARDYTGMLLYSRLLQQGMISKTMVSESVRSVTGNAKQLVIGDRHRRVTAEADFETDSNRWKPTVTLAKPVPPRASSQPGAKSGPPQLKKPELLDE